MITPETPQRGSFDLVTLKAAVHGKPPGDDEDLMDLACVYTCLKEDAVYDIATGAPVTWWCLPLVIPKTMA